MEFNPIGSNEMRDENMERRTGIKSDEKALEEIWKIGYRKRDVDGIEQKLGMAADRTIKNENENAICDEIGTKGCEEKRGRIEKIRWENKVKRLEEREQD